MIRTTRSLARAASTIALLCALANPAARAAQDYEFPHENVMGTSMELLVRADSEEAARAAEARALGEIDRLAAIFSGYDTSSEFRRWQATRGTPAKVSPELFELLAASDAWRERSGGAWDPRVQALTGLWSRCAKLDRLPTDAELAEAKALMGRAAWRLDAANGTAEHLSACPLSLNSIAKGYIIGRACEAAMDRGKGVRGVLLNIGGDVRVVGDVARTVGIAPPLGDSETAEPIAVVEVRDRSVATSGSSQRGVLIGGAWYSHIFDPRTGRPSRHVAGATVIAERAADANALATTLNVLPVEEGLRLVKSLPGFECLIVAADGRVRTSDGWAAYERPTVRLAALAAPVPQDRKAPRPKEEPKAPKAKSWGDDYELKVDFEINQPEGAGGRYRRPYVAAWVEDKDGLAVRTLALWLQAKQPGPRWHPELKRWFRDDKVRQLADETSLIDTVSRATRPPGKYSVTWDGKDDQGKALKPGTYTVFIEAAREHGTYQIIRKEITVGDKPFQETLKGNVEIKSASLEYRRKDPKR
jgi:thiamine biosynthesis lipoprotein ApbE